MFRTKYDYSKHICPVSSTGDGTEVIYKLTIDAFGVEHVVPDSLHDMYSQIQSFKEACNIETIINRHLAGDDSALYARQGEYFDATNMPSTYAELFQRVNDCKDMFDKLPLETKEKFNMSPYEFWSSIDTPLWAAKLGFIDNLETGEKDTPVKLDKVVSDVKGGDVIE